MTPKEAVDIVKKSNSSLTIDCCKDYGTDFLITAFENSDDMDPFYLVNKRDGSVRGYTIAENPTRYYNTPNVKY